MFRSRFTDAFPPKCPHLGPQDIERGIVDPVPSPQVESLLCALLGLALNRKKPVEYVTQRLIPVAPPPRSLQKDIWSCTHKVIVGSS